MQNSLISKLKQSLIEKQYAHRFSELLQPTIKLNKDEKTHLQIIAQANSLLPSISNAKLSLNSRNKSHSAKRLPSKSQLEKNSNSKSTKKIFNQQSHKEEPAKKQDFEDLIVKKQSLVEATNSKQNVLRTKLFSLKTPSREGDRLKQATHTKDITISNSKEGSGIKTDRSKAITIRDFNARIESLNEDLLLSIKGGSIDSASFDNKKIMASLNKLKSSNEEEYSKIHKIIDKVMRFIEKHQIHSCSIDFKALMQLQGKKVLSNHQIISVFANKVQIIANHRIVGLQYYTQPEQKGKNLAAQKITSLFKMIFSKRFYKNLNGLLTRVKIIQKYWRMSLLVRKTRRIILQRTQAKLKFHHNLQKELCKQWNLIKTCQRFEIHVCSYSLQEFKRLTTKNLRQKENIQISRIFRAVETDVSVIYVCPFQLKEEIMKYYSSVFNFNQGNGLQQKIYFVIPENRARIEEEHCSITTVSALLYSPKALRRIKQIVGKQYAFIIPSFPSVQYISLSGQLGIPILSANPNLMKLYSTKSGSKRLLSNISRKDKAPFAVPKSVVSIFSEKQLINSLSILIFKNKQIKVWYLKIEDEVSSRGLAYLNINKVAFLREMCSESNEFEQVSQTEMIKLIADELHNKLKNRLKIVNKDIYSNYDQYISHFLTRGGVIEARVQGDKQTQFSISFMIEPSGQFLILGTYNKLQLGGKSINQSIRFPSALKEIDYEGITRNLYKELFIKQRLYGYFAADFVYCHQTSAVCALGLDCFLNEKTSSLFMVNFCCNSHFEKDTNCLVNLKNQALHYTYCPSITLQGMPSMSTFFKNCKFQNISFDLQKRRGSIFVLVDQLQSEQIGFITIDQNQLMILRQLRKMVQYFCKVYRPSKSSHDQIGLLKGAITTSLKQQEKKILPKHITTAYLD